MSRLKRLMESLESIVKSSVRENVQTIGMKGRDCSGKYAVYKVLQRVL